MAKLIDTIEVELFFFFIRFLNMSAVLLTMFFKSLTFWFYLLNIQWYSSYKTFVLLSYENSATTFEPGSTLKGRQAYCPWFYITNPFYSSLVSRSNMIQGFEFQKYKLLLLVLLLLLLLLLLRFRVHVLQFCGWLESIVAVSL